MNITDVDDKTIRDSQKEGKSLKDFTEFYTKGFLEDLKTLNIQMPDIMPKATEEIDGMVKLIKILLKKKIAYKTENGDIYFSISKFKEYGKLANLNLKQLKKNADGRLNAADEYEKEDARDFALWKAYDKRDGDVFWEEDIEINVSDKEYNQLIEEAIKNNDLELLKLNGIDKTKWKK